MAKRWKATYLNWNNEPEAKIFESYSGNYNLINDCQNTGIDIDKVIKLEQVMDAPASETTNLTED